MEGMMASANLAFAFSRGLRNIVTVCEHTRIDSGRFEHVYRSLVLRTTSFVAVVATGRTPVLKTRDPEHSLYRVMTRQIYANRVICHMHELYARQLVLSPYLNWPSPS